MGIIKSVQMFIGRNSSKILLILGTGGMIASSVLAVKNTPKALQLIDQRKEDLEVEKLTPVEMVKTTWKCYILPFSICLSSIGCLVGSNIIDGKKIATLSTAYALSEDIFREYKNKVIETIGEEKEKDIQKEVNEKTSEKITDNKIEVQFSSFGDVPCLDKYTKQIFWSTKEKIGAIINKLNFKMLNENYISVEDYCFEIGTDVDDSYGKEFGWNVNDGYLEPEFSVYELNNEFVNGRPVLLVELSRIPDRNYNNMH